MSGVQRSMTGGKAYENVIAHRRPMPIRRVRRLVCARVPRRRLEPPLAVVHVRKALAARDPPVQVVRRVGLAALHLHGAVREVHPPRDGARACVDGDWPPVGPVHAEVELGQVEQAPRLERQGDLIDECIVVADLRLRERGGQREIAIHMACGGDASRRDRCATPRERVCTHPGRDEPRVRDVELVCVMLQAEVDVVDFRSDLVVSNVDGYERRGTAAAHLQLGGMCLQEGCLKPCSLLGHAPSTHVTCNGTRSTATASTCGKSRAISNILPSADVSDSLVQRDGAE